MAMAPKSIDAERQVQPALTTEERRKLDVIRSYHEINFRSYQEQGVSREKINAEFESLSKLMRSAVFDYTRQEAAAILINSEDPSLRVRAEGKRGVEEIRCQLAETRFGQETCRKFSDKALAEAEGRRLHYPETHGGEIMSTEMKLKAARGYYAQSVWQEVINRMGSQTLVDHYGRAKNLRLDSPLLIEDELKGIVTAITPEQATGVLERASA